MYRLQQCMYKFQRKVKMNATESNCLKQLLISWELEDLFELLKDEEISINVLRVMKRHHLAELLINQKLGIRIRFEHHFEQWRQLIRKPLGEPSTLDTQMLVNTTAKTTKNPSASSVSDRNSTADIAGPSHTSRPFITIAKRQTLDEESLLIKPNVSAAEEVQTTSATNSSKYQHVNAEKQSKDKGVTVLKVLIESGFKGESLLQAYEEQQTFTPLQRQLLISLIVSYFEMKNYHLSLSTSQILEKQILDLFPTEQVEYYRGKKKSKIYMKYNNVKRRDTDFFPSKKRRPANANEAENSNSDIEMVSDNLSHSTISKENAVESILSDGNSYLIKSEYFSD